MRCFALVGAMLFACLLTVHGQGQGPEQRYVEIYYAIQEADGLNEKGQLPQAATKYLEAQAALQDLQRQNPNWEQNVVKYRLDYIASKLEPLAGKVPVASPPSTPGVAPVPDAVKPPLAEAPGTNRIQDLEAEISRLTSQNTVLQAKLKEALSVQPAAVDPRELAKADEKIKELEKERDLLKVSLEQSKTVQPPAATPAEQEQKILTEVKQKLAQQTALVESLQKENDVLKLQMEAMKHTQGATGSGGALAQELEVTKLTLAALQKTNISLRADVIMMEKKLEELTKTGVSRTTYQQLESERDELRAKLNEATKQLARGTGPTAEASREELARQLDAALAKLAVYEAKPVPYTPEELALFKQVDLKVSMSNVPPQKKAPQPPPGAAPLLDQAERYLSQGKLEDAEKVLQDVLRQAETNIFVLSRLAGVQVDLLRYEQASATLKKALAVDPQDGASLFVLGQLRLYEKKYDEALDALSLSSKLAPNDYRTHYFLGKVMIEKGNRAAAEASLRKSVQLREGFAEGHFSLALIYANQQPPFRELAQWHYQKALSNGFKRSPEFEKLLEEKKAATTN